MESKSTLPILLAAIIISSTLFSSFEVEPQMSYLSLDEGNSYSGNNSSNTTNSSITITSPINGSNVHEFSTTFTFSVSNYTGYVYWNASNTDNSSSNNSFQTWYSYGSSNYNASGQGQGQGQGNHTYRSLLDGNYTVCVSLPTGENDCISIWHSYLPTSINITSPWDNETVYSTAGNSSSFYYEITNHSGYVYWNITDLDNSASNSTSSWTTYIYQTGHSGYPAYRSIQEGNYTVCAYLNSGESDCVTFRRMFYQYSFDIIDPSNGSIMNIDNSTNVILTVNYSVTNFSGSVHWQLIDQQTQNISMYWYESVASGWYWIYNMTTVNITTNSSKRLNNFNAHLTNGNYTLCANLGTGETECVSFTILLPPLSITIVSPGNNSVINTPQWSNNNVDYLRLQASVNNYSGYIHWNATSTDHSSNISTISWNSYVYSNTNTSDTYRSVGYGNVTVCASINNANNVSVNPNSRLNDCIEIQVIPRTATVAIASIQSISNSSLINSAYLYYDSDNHSHGYVYVNGNQRGYIGSKYSSGQYNNSSNGSSQNHASYYIQSYYLTHGNNTICVEVFSEDGRNVSDCITYFIPYPQYRLIIESPVNQTDFYNGFISLSYETENYSGTIFWTLNSQNGNMSTSSYASTYLRTIDFTPDFFGIIDICGSFNVNTTPVQSCVTVNLVPRPLEGGIVAPLNNSVVGAYVTIEYWAHNFTYGEITINGNTIDTMGSHFTSNGSGISEEEQNNMSNNNSTSVNYDYTYANLSYGISTICLELAGENATVLLDCIVVNRVVPTHLVQITSPVNNSNIISSNITVTYLLKNSTSHQFTVDGQSASIWSAGSGSISSWIQIYTGFGNHTICVISYDFASQMHSDCIDVSMLDPNADADSDGVSDHSDYCPNTPSSEISDSNGCSPSQLDDDNDGIMNNHDQCANTVLHQSVDSSGCSAAQRDSDGDGVSDLNDACPNSPQSAVTDANGCADSQLDSDNDGVSDDVDICPNTIVGSQVDSDGCANSQKDSDSDGVVDSFDQCPNTALNTVVDQTGCPHSSNSGGSNGSSGSEEPSSGGLPGFEPLYLVISIFFALIVISRKKA